MIETMIADLHQEIQMAAGNQTLKPDRKFHKDEEYLCYGLKATDFYNIMKRFDSRFLTLTLEKRLEFATALLSENIGELGHAGIHVVAISVLELLPEQFSILDYLAEHFRSWSHVDHLCLEVMQPLLPKYTKETLALLESWNRSSNRWKRRASVVTFVRKVGKSGEFSDDVLRLCDNLIWDGEDTVQKGVGWVLKDNLRSAPDRILPYIKRLREQGVSSTITLYAIRGLKTAERKEILAIKPKRSNQLRINSSGR
ncbi:MAG: DNA alkylation repair protein [Candidatus Omnitrophota bacterium]|jgi:3-methyladenine DNA glycosylase AlkD|nr:MAG: DNA alkylation repair protein [Candidatus Omnitrophota bacterium]